MRQRFPADAISDSEYTCVLASTLTRSAMPRQYVDFVISGRKFDSFGQCTRFEQNADRIGERRSVQ